MIFFSVTVNGQGTKLKVKFPKVDRTKTHFYSPTFRTDTYHRIEGIGNLYEPFDSIKDNRIFITSLNMDEIAEDSLIRKCEDPKNKLKIIVDTSQLAIKELNFYEPFQLDDIYYSYPRQILTKDYKKLVHKNNLTKDTIINVIAQPVYIANLSKDIRYLKGISGNISVTQQAKDKNNRWRDIETPIMPSCGMVRYICELYPNDFVLTTVLRFEGNYKTQLRIKLEANNQIYYSETFTGLIDYLQIENSKIKMVDSTFYERL